MLYFRSRCCQESRVLISRLWGCLSWVAVRRWSLVSWGSRGQELEGCPVSPSLAPPALLPGCHGPFNVVPALKLANHWLYLWVKINLFSFELCVFVPAMGKVTKTAFLLKMYLIYFNQLRIKSIKLCLTWFYLIAIQINIQVIKILNIKILTLRRRFCPFSCRTVKTISTSPLNVHLHSQTLNLCDTVFRAKYWTREGVNLQSTYSLLSTFI